MKHGTIKSITVTSLLSIGVGFPAWCSAAACPTINVHYNERVPYLVTTDQGVEGLTATPAQRAFEQAGISFAWKKTPSKRQMKILQDNEGCDCLVGWFKNPQREKFAKYTLPIYRDKPQISIARADNAALHNGMSVDDLLSDSRLVMGAKDGYSYGKFLDDKLAQYTPKIDRATIENIQMLMKVHSQRNDYFFIAPEEADGLITASDFPEEDFKYVTFANMPQGERRYVLCSQQVGDGVIKQLNDAIQTNSP